MYLTPVLKSDLGKWICSVWQPVDTVAGLFKYSQWFKGFKHSPVRCGISLLSSFPFHPSSDPQELQDFYGISDNLSC